MKKKLIFIVLSLSFIIISAQANVWNDIEHLKKTKANEVEYLMSGKYSISKVKNILNNFSEKEKNAVFFMMFNNRKVTLEMGKVISNQMSYFSNYSTDNQNSLIFYHNNKGAIVSKSDYKRLVNLAIKFGKQKNSVGALKSLITLKGFSSFHIELMKNKKDIIKKQTVAEITADAIITNTLYSDLNAVKYAYELIGDKKAARKLRIAKNRQDLFDYFFANKKKYPKLFNNRIIEQFARNSKNPMHLAEIAQTSSRYYLLYNSHIPIEILEILANDKDENIAKRAMEHTNYKSFSKNNPINKVKNLKSFRKYLDAYVGMKDEVLPSSQQLNKALRLVSNDLQKQVKSKSLDLYSDLDLRAILQKGLANKIEMKYYDFMISFYYINKKGYKKYPFIYGLMNSSEILPLEVLERLYNQNFTKDNFIYRTPYMRFKNTEVDDIYKDLALYHILSHENINTKYLQLGLSNRQFEVRERAILHTLNTKTLPNGKNGYKILDKYSNDPHGEIRNMVAILTDNEQLLSQLASDSHYWVRSNVANRSKSANILKKLSKDKNTYVVESVLGNPYTPVEILKSFENTKIVDYVKALASNPNVSRGFLEKYADQNAKIYDELDFGSVSKWETLKKIMSNPKISKKMMEEYKSTAFGKNIDKIKVGSYVSVAGNPNFPKELFKKVVKLIMKDHSRYGDRIPYAILNSPHMTKELLKEIIEKGENMREIYNDISEKVSAKDLKEYYPLMKHRNNGPIYLSGDPWRTKIINK